LEHGYGTVAQRYSCPVRGGADLCPWGANIFFEEQIPVVMEELYSFQTGMG
jgi:hypothetical protein